MGEISDWKSLGKWIHNKLLLGRGQVSEETKGKILELVAGVQDPIEKAKIDTNLYRIIQDI